MTVHGRPTWAEISLPRLRENFRAIRALIGPAVKVMAVVKADAYGHGARDVARSLVAEGAEWFGVTCSSEALPLRRSGIEQPILLLGGFWPGEEDRLFSNRLTPAIFRNDQLDGLSRGATERGVRAAFHLKIDTGMHRLGFSCAELPKVLEQIRARPNLSLEGVFTHLASADESPESVRKQLDRFQCALDTVRAGGFDPELIHAANSAALARVPESRGTMVRPGLALYGYQLGESPLEVQPVLSLKSRVIALRDVPAGGAVGYGGTYVARAPARIATAAAGYADGIPRALSNSGRALIRGAPAPIAGRVNMDFTTLDVTNIPGVEVGDEAVFIGRQAHHEITALEVANAASTVVYEVLCNIGPRVPRIPTSDF